ncbi:MAG: phosphoribosylglycinamide synthetase [Sphingobium sp.]|nr:phosphoribosylglycinamide synthetase [Sphingobium sp.]
MTEMLQPRSAGWQLEPMRISARARETLDILFIAKHALGDGNLHHEDGNHAVYHHEMRTVLEGLGLKLRVADSYEVLFGDPGVDYVFPLYNRGGFLNSEMLLPLLCSRLGVPCLGASPILRGLSDDKHLSKLAAAARGVATAPWAIYRRGAPIDPTPCPEAERYVIKPNASSASWGVTDATDWTGVKIAIQALHDDGHDAIVEPFVEGSDIEVPVITRFDEPVILPPLLFRQADPAHLRSYWEKRDLVERQSKYELVPLEDDHALAQARAMTERLWGEYRPFDYGRFEYRYDEQTGQVLFLEQNLNCNLWSRKVFGRSAAMVGLDQSDLIETILAEGLRRNGLADGRRGPVGFAGGPRRIAA